MAATRLGGAVLVTAMAAVIVSAPAAAARSSPWIELRAYHLAAGSDLEVHGGRFDAASTVRLSLLRAGRRISLGAATVDERGSFFESVYLPVTLAPGSYQVLAAGPRHVVARAPLELTSALPGSAPPPTPTVPPRLVVTLPRSIRVEDFRLKRHGSSWPWAITTIAVAACALLAGVLFTVRRRSSSSPPRMPGGAAILTIGNELVSGDVPNSNASWLAKRLEARGVKVVLVASVPDDLDRIVAFVRRESPLVDHLIVTGGLGGTPDDITRESIAAAFGVPQEVVAEVADDLRSRFTGDPDYVTGWAALPQGSRPLENPLGGAPGFLIQNVWVLPGLPSEMEAMFERYAEEFRGPAPIAAWRRLYRTRESVIAPVLETATERWPEVLVGSYPAFPDTGPEVEVVLKSSHPDRLAEATAFIEAELGRL